MNVTIGVVAGIVLTSIALGLGIAVRSGMWRGFEPNYRNPDLPIAYRNTPFALIPLGIAFASALLAGLLPLPSSLRGVSLLLFALFPAWALVAFLVAHRPPRVFKPKWLQDHEANQAPTSATTNWFDVAVFVGTIGAAALSLVAILMLVVLEA
jgi:hypothetical protein